MTTTVASALEQARTLGVARLDAQLLIGHVLQRPRSWLISHDGDALERRAHEAIDCLLRRCAAGEPVAYLLGEKEFHGLTLKVTPAVLIPRPDTETLVDWALEVLSKGQPQNARVLDLGTGSGAIALALKHRHGSAQVTAVDTTQAALEVARDNARRLGLEVEFLHGDWWAGLAGRRFDLVVSNPPYIADGDPHLPALRHEPELALTSGADGLSSLRQIAASAPAHLNRGGWLLVEHGHDQSLAVQALLLDAGLQGVETRNDLAGIGRCTGGQWR